MNLVNFQVVGSFQFKGKVACNFDKNTLTTENNYKI